MVDAEHPDDVYSALTYAGSGLDGAKLKHWSIQLSTEPSPMSLPRVFGLLGTLNMVPTLAETTLVDDNSIEITLRFSDIDALTADRLIRKLRQLTEIIVCRVPI